MVVQNNRNTWVELLRFIAISLILSTHFLFNNGLYGKGPDLSCGVAVFIFISGFFSGNKTEWRTKKFAITVAIGTCLGLILYGILFACAFPVQNPLNFFFGDFIAGKYTSGWFIYLYLAFTLISPFINRFIKKYNKGIVLGIIIVFCLCSIAFSRFDPGNNLTYTIMTFNKLFYFTGTYSFGAWFCIHVKDNVGQNRRPVKSLIFLILSVACMLLLGYREQIVSFLSNHSFETMFLHDFFDIFAAISLTLLFFSLPTLKLNLFNKVFAGLGKISLSMYLVHASAGMVLDRFYQASPAVYNLSFYALKFFLYYLTAVAFAIVMYYIEKYIEIGCYKVASKIKARVNP